VYAGHSCTAAALLLPFDGGLEHNPRPRVPAGRKQNPTFQQGAFPISEIVSMHTAWQGRTKLLKHRNYMLTKFKPRVK